MIHFKTLSFVAAALAIATSPAFAQNTNMSKDPSKPDSTIASEAPDAKGAMGAPPKMTAKMKKQQKMGSKSKSAKAPAMATRGEDGSGMTTSGNTMAK